MGVGAGRLVPALSEGPGWPYALLGSGFALLGVALIVYGEARRRAVERALDTGGFAPFGNAAGLAFTAAGVLLGLATVVLVLADA